MNTISKVKYSLLFILAAFIVAGCGKKQDGGNMVALNGGIKGGGIFIANELENIRSLDPVGINDVVSHHVSHQIYDGLIDLDTNLQIVPMLSKRWEISPDGLTYTFYLRNDVTFHDNACFPDGKGRKFIAQDVVYSFTRVLDPRTGSLGFDFYKNYVEGAKEYNEEISKATSEKREPKLMEVSGYKALNDTTFQIKLKKSFAPFIYYMCQGFAYIVPKEAVDKYGKDYFQNPVGTGPFVFQNWTPDLEINLKRNPNYWDKDVHGNQIPYLEGVKFRFIKDLSQQLLEFKNGNLYESYRIPNELFKTIVNEDKTLTPEYSQFTVQRKTALSTQYYGFLVTSKVFSDVKVRQAFNYAIDREKILKYVLNGSANDPAIYGMVPPVMPNYNAKQVKGYSFDLAKAKQLMIEAGYPGGAGFPEVTLNINEGGGRNTQIAEAIQDMLREIGVTVKLQLLQFAQHLDNIDAGRSDFYRLGWNADYPDPETFLNLFYGKNVPSNPKDVSPINSFRYVNPEYDALFEKAISTVDIAERNRLYEQAEQLAVNDAVCLFIYYDEDWRLVQSFVRGFALDPMHRVNMRFTWLDK
ncbi:MAG TPA: ABC transporter substrate-binding protein [Ignavibacteria bacterium]|nr:ABC transporter substrate-binding protein [Ignavibacteria bacterium]HRJ03721.1 ABC transporter substrate-binding protein [Ignavibacteria bacterium]HRJ85729.1 ABC transporter substrate-binding protein [Ignavibacteria bacterium]